MFTKWIYLCIAILIVIDYFANNSNYDASIFSLLILIACQNFSIQNSIENNKY